MGETDVVEQIESRYDLKSDRIVEALFEPVNITHKEFYDCVLRNYADSGEINYLTADSNSITSAYHHVSGTGISIDDDRIYIIGTERAVNDAQKSLELLTQYRLNEVSRALT